MTKVRKLVIAALFVVCAGGAVAQDQVVAYVLSRCCGGPPPLCPGSPGCPVAIAKK